MGGARKARAKSKGEESGGTHDDGFGGLVVCWCWLALRWMEMELAWLWWVLTLVAFADYIGRT